MGEPVEVARSIAFLASPMSSFTSGTNLLVDGGDHPERADVAGAARASGGGDAAG